MNYPDDAWLLLTDEYLYLMNSNLDKRFPPGDDRYHERKKIQPQTNGEKIIPQIPPGWVIKSRNLIISPDKKPKDINEK